MTRRHIFESGDLSLVLVEHGRRSREMRNNSASSMQLQKLRAGRGHHFAVVHAGLEGDVVAHANALVEVM